jgi:hypothetical protein
MNSEGRGTLLALVGQHLFDFGHSDGWEPAGHVICKHTNPTMCPPDLTNFLSSADVTGKIKAMFQFESVTACVYVQRRSITITEMFRTKILSSDIHEDTKL